MPLIPESVTNRECAQLFLQVLSEALKRVEAAEKAADHQGSPKDPSKVSRNQETGLEGPK
jgi:hypothetical protein